MASISVAGDSSGSITIAAPAVAGSGTLTLPVATDTLAGIAATQTLTNKTLVAPALGTPASGVLTNCTGVVAGALPAGSVLQVVNGTTSTETSNSSSTYADTTLTATITPKFVTSKILAIVNQTGCAKSAANITVSYRLLRGSTTICSFETQSGYTDSVSPLRFGGTGCSFLDSPATTSATIYKTQLVNNGTGSAVAQTSSSTSTITLMEIAG